MPTNKAPQKNGTKPSEKVKPPSVIMSLFPKRSFNDDVTEFESNFNNRIIDLFKTDRNTKLSEFAEDTKTFFKTLYVELIRDDNNRYVTLTRLVKILKKSPASIRDLLPYSTVLALVRLTNFNCTIDVSLIEELVKVVTHAEETYIKLLPFAENSREISAYALQEYVASYYVPQMVEEPERADYYAAFAVGVIFFFLDARRKEFITLQDLLSSTLLFHLEACIDAENNCYPMPPFDYFTVGSFRYALKEFRSLDIDRNGVLSVDEMLVFRNYYFNTLFIRRVFEISQVYEGGCLDFKGFVDLLCAIKFRWTSASAKYHFEALDLKDDGILDAEEIQTMTHLMPEYADKEDLQTDVLTAELNDMLHLNKTISMTDFVRNGMTTTFTGVITNYPDYAKYERREQ